MAVGTTADAGGRHWSIGEMFKLLVNGEWIEGARGFAYITAPNGFFMIATNGRLYQVLGPGQFQVTTMPVMGCRLPPSKSGATVLQANSYLVDKFGGIWIAACSYFVFATYCPDFIGATNEPATVLRNGFRFPEPGGMRSMPEPNNAPWNLKWCGGEMFVHLAGNDTPPNHGYARWLGPQTLEWAAAAEADCGTELPPSSLSAPTNVRIVAN